MAYAAQEKRVVQDERTSARDHSRIHQRQCARCHRWFWAWHPERERCFVCEPLPPSQLREVLAQIAQCAG